MLNSPRQMGRTELEAKAQTTTDTQTQSDRRRDGKTQRYTGTHTHTTRQRPRHRCIHAKKQMEKKVTQKCGDTRRRDIETERTRYSQRDKGASAS